MEMINAVNDVPTGSSPPESNKKTRLSWKSRCIEMRGIRRNQKRTNNNRDTSSVYYRVEYPVNLLFEKYYKDQKICKDDDDWNLFMEYNHKLLPVSFRINTSSSLWTYTLTKLMDIIKDYDELSLRSCINYHPEYLKSDVDLFYQMDTDRSSLRKNEKYIEFSKFLIAEDTRGSLCRQETVSMLPVLFLDPEPHENILDLCAAPGMKLLQIIDVVESKLQFKYKLDSTQNRGIIIGNDISQSRVSTLTHHIKSMNSTSVCVTNYDASRFPSIYDIDGNSILFDRILADMPCSCDGTLRKSIDVWKTWQPLNGLHLHKIQLSILKRAIQLLKPGGVLIYSTCSLNPLENEAIASFIVANGDELQVDLMRLKSIDGIKYEYGLVNWLVPNPDGGYYTCYDDVVTIHQSRIVPSMFKTPKWNKHTASNVMRILPHYNNTGGFFIFAIKKRQPNSLCPAESPPPEVTTTVGLADSSSNYLSLKSNATPGDRGEVSHWTSSGLPVSDLRELEGEINKGAVCKTTSGGTASGMESSTGPRVEPVADLREAEGQLNKEADGRTSIVPPTEDYVNSSDVESGPNKLHHDLVFSPKRRSGGKLLHEYQLWYNISDEYKNISSFYGLDINSDLIRQMIVKKSGDSNVYIISKSPVICHCYKHRNKGPYKYELLKYSIAGVRIFTRLESKATMNSSCDLRITQEGCNILYKFMTRRILYTDLKYGKFILEKGMLTHDEVIEAECEENLKNLNSCRLNGQIESGGCILLINFDSNHENPLVISCLFTGSGQLYTYIQKEILESINRILN